MEIMESEEEKNQFDLAVDLPRSPMSDALSLDPCMLDG
jgi:hypothetical protein